MENRELLSLHQIPIELQTIDLFHQIGELSDKVGLKSDVVFKDDAGAELSIDDLISCRHTQHTKR